MAVLYGIRKQSGSEPVTGSLPEQSSGERFPGQPSDQSALEDPDPADAQKLQVPQPRVALTFDDGPHPVYTKKLLDGLKSRGIRATFFVVGENISGNEPTVT